MFLTPEFIRSETMREFIVIGLHKQSEAARIKAWEKLNPDKLKARQARYNRSAKGKAKFARYEAKPESKARFFKYNRTEKFKLKKLRWRLRNPERVKAIDEACKKKYVESGKALAAKRAWVAKNPEKARAYGRAAGKRRWATSRGRFITIARNRIRDAIKSAGLKMPASASKLIGCDWDTLRAHLESQFTEGMSWSNYGKWHADHIIPISSFDLTDPEQVARCFSWRNMQPLWAFDNLSKGAKLIYIKKNTQPTLCQS